MTEGAKLLLTPTLCAGLLGLPLAAMLLTSCLTENTRSPAPATLKDAYKKDFPIGVAINENQFSGKDSRGAAIIQAQFNSISPENILKWESVHPRADGYAFEGPDRYVEFGQANKMLIIGHTLVWHHQTPNWVFQDTNGQPVDRETLLQRMHDHIQTVVGRYKGRIKVWDVVNEALDDNGNLRQSRWMKIIGEDYIAKAFQYAHQADPAAVLRYNDYSLEKEPKRNGAIALIKKLQAQGVPVTAIGLQDHVKLIWPTAEEEDATISAFAKLGLKVMITELDMDTSAGTQRNQNAEINPEVPAPGEANQFTNGLPASVQQQLAGHYADLFGVFVKHRDVVSLVTFWGLTDRDSWLNSRNRVNHPLLFDRNGQPKPAFQAVIAAARGGQGVSAH
jgi:endo-1,4-beta-xylanase